MTLAVKTHRKRYTCKRCKVVFNSNRQSVKHRLAAGWTCSKCRKVYNSDCEAFVHDSKANHRSFECSKCLAKCRNKKVMLSHECSSRTVKDFKEASKATPNGLNDFKLTIVWDNELEVPLEDVLMDEGANPLLSQLAGNDEDPELDLFNSLSVNEEKNPKKNRNSYLCSLCGKTLKGLTSYTRHQVTHTGQRPFKCNLCPKTFTQNQRLTIHKRVHTGERPYLCPLCGKTFTESCKLKRHLNKIHQGQKQASNTQKSPSKTKC